MEEVEDLSPFWLQTNSRRGGRGSSIFLNNGIFLILLLVTAAAFLFVIIPSFLSFTSQFRPLSIKKSWDSLNFVLVLFAIVCGFLSRKVNNNNNNDNNNNSVSSETSSSLYYNHNQNSDHDHNFNRSWYYHDQERRAYNTSFNRLRSISSYPDLRQEPPWIDNNERWRFYDDTYVNKNYQFQPKVQEVEQIKQVTKEEETVSIKDVQEEVSLPNPPSSPPKPPSPPLPPPQQESQVVKRKVKRTYEDIGHSMREEEKHMIVNNIYTPTPSPPPPLSPLPPPQPSAAVVHKNEKKRGKDILISLKRRRKKQRQKSVDNIGFLFEEDPSLLQPPPPPPPPPPPHKLFQNLFNPKKNKAKKVHSSPPPPPPPPPPRFKSHASKTRVNASTLTTTTVNKPSNPIMTSSFFETEENLPSGNASPLIPIPPPPPPPPPPFKMAPWKFRMVGDYVRVASFDSSRSGSPELESGEEGLSDKEPMSPMKASLFCPSPDVNTKADNFIAKFKANLKLEKINSVKGRSVLGPQQ